MQSCHLGVLLSGGGGGSSMTRYSKAIPSPNGLHKNESEIREKITKCTKTEAWLPEEFRGNSPVKFSSLFLILVYVWTRHGLHHCDSASGKEYWGPRGGQVWSEQAGGPETSEALVRQLDGDPASGTTLSPMHKSYEAPSLYLKLKRVTTWVSMPISQESLLSLNWMY